MPTIKELKAELDAKGIDYTGARAKKDFEALLGAPSKPAGKGSKTRPNGDIVIGLSITTADGSDHTDEIRITNPRGCMPASQVMNPDYVVNSLKKELSDRFGRLHIR